MEEEFRSSKVYKTLENSGSYVAEKLAQGLGKAAEGIDGALNGINQNRRNVPPPAGNYQQPGGPRPGYYRYQQGAPGPQNGQPVPPPYNAPPGPGQPPRQAPQGYGYQYQAPPQPGAPRTTSTRTGAPPYRPQPGAPRANGSQPRPGAQGVPGTPPPMKNQKVRQAPPPQMPQMKMVRKPSAAKYYITGGTAILYALTLPLYEPAHFAIFAAVLVMMFLLSGAVFRGKKQFVPVESEKPREEPKKEEKPSNTGNPEVDKIIDEGSEYLKKLRAANAAIPDESLSECIDRMERSSEDIFKYISANPVKAPQIRKFMNYYLPTTLKLLGSYQRLAGQSVKGENITSTMFNIAGMMHTVADAFEKQLDSLFSDEAMDISADITVFETMLKQEGFVEEKKG